MNRKMFSARRLTGFGVLALVAGAAGAQAAGGGSSSPEPEAPRAMSAAVAPASAPVSVPPAAARWPFRNVVPMGCRAPGKMPAGAPPSAALKEAFGILRRERTDDDALPPRLLKALERRGLEVVDPDATRLLRADRRARAWVVPVPDVTATPTVVCRGGAARRAARARAQARARHGGATTVKPREGLAVVSVEGAPSGGGGALRDLQRGLAPPSVDPCAGAQRDMVGVSGIVPDGVEAVFVTSADGSATRADVRDNGYSFVLPRPRRPESRYLVWTGADGTPHVQPLPALEMFLHVGPCRADVMATAPRVTPDPWSAACGPVTSSIMLANRLPRRATPALPGRTPRLRPGGGVVIPARPLPAPMPLGLCAPLDVALMAAPPVLRAPRPVPPRFRGGAPAPSAAPAPRAPRAVPAPSAATVPRAPRPAPVPTTPAAPKPAPPRAP